MAGTAQSLPRTSRVRRRPDFDRAYQTGTRVGGRFMAILVVANGGPCARLGVATSRKLGSAVERNRARRLAREIFRRHTVASGIDIIVVPRREMLDASFSSLEADYLDLLARRDQPRRRPAGGPSRHTRRARPASRL